MEGLGNRSSEHASGRSDYDERKEMSAKFNPYETLGVERTATSAEIKKAAKKQARASHPDAGGNADDFHAGRRALAILIDPKRRERFDTTGDAAEVEPDNRVAQALEMIYHGMAAVTNAYLTSSFDSRKDPRRMDLIATIETSIFKQIGQGNELVRTGEQHARFLRDFKSRFTKKSAKNGTESAFDFIARKLDDEISAVESKSEEVKEMITVAKIALKMIRTYDFRFDPPAPNNHMNSYSIGHWRLT
jgi:curved DNA-binding protein CbpA